MEKKNHNFMNETDKIEFGDYIITNFVFAIGFVHWICFFGFGFNVIKLLSYNFFPISMLSWFCAITFVYFVFKIILFDILLSNKQIFNK